MWASLGLGASRWLAEVPGVSSQWEAEIMTETERSRGLVGGDLRGRNENFLLINILMLLSSSWDSLIYISQYTFSLKNKMRPGSIRWWPRATKSLCGLARGPCSDMKPFVSLHCLGVDIIDLNLSVTQWEGDADRYLGMQDWAQSFPGQWGPCKWAAEPCRWQKEKLRAWIKVTEEEQRWFC